MSIGYACLVIGENGTKISHCLLKNAKKDELQKLTFKNLAALEAIIDYNIKQDIRLFRISSDIIPFGSHPINQRNWKEEFCEQFFRIGEKIKKANIRVSMHPGQYTVLNSPNNQIVKSAILDLEYHTAFLEALSTDYHTEIVLHIGGVYEDKEKSMERFIENYNILEKSIKNRLVIENDDKNYSVGDVLNISQRTGIPVVFDNLHHRLNPSKETFLENEWIEKCSKTWGNKDGKQKIHYSQSDELGGKTAHSKTIGIGEFSKFYNKLQDKEIDIMLEVKDKNLSAVKCINSLNPNLKMNTLENEWARYKYLVLSRSAALYNNIREILKDKININAISFYEIIEKSMSLKEDKGAQINAAQHIWGYVNDVSTLAQKKRYYKLLNEYEKGESSIDILKNHLLKCARIQEKEYLINSYYFYL